MLTVANLTPSATSSSLALSGSERSSISPPKVGKSGQSERILLPARGFQTHARTNLEVSRLGTQWAQPGNSGQTASLQIASVLSHPITPVAPEHAGVAREPSRARMWKFAIPLRHPETGRALVDLDRLRSSLDRKSISHYMWLIHDQDEGSSPHLQGTLRLGNSRTRDLLASITGLPPSTFRPLVDKSGQHGAFERYCRYLLHEGPEAQADGKFRYLDSDAHANFDFREMIDRYFGYAASAPVVSADQIKLMVFRGEMSPADVEATFPMVYIRHFKFIETLHEKGREERRKRSEDLEQVARQEEARRLVELDQARRRHLSAQGFNDVEVDLAIKEGLSEDALLFRNAEAERHAAERRRFDARAATERNEQEERARIERLSPEYRARMQRESVEEERQFIVAAIAMALDIRGDAETRDTAVFRAASAQGFTSKDYLPDEDLSIEDARTFYIDVSDLGGKRSNDTTAIIREDIALLRNDLARAPGNVGVAEFHAAEGDLKALDRALRLRAMYTGYPDLVTLPVPRNDLTKSQRAQLLQAA